MAMTLQLNAGIGVKAVYLNRILQNFNTDR